MGMDVLGISPVSEQGRRFHNTVWWWRPLWQYCEEIAPDLIPADNSGHSNNGWGLDASGALALANRLLEAVASGETQKYEERYRAHLEALPLEPCKICDGTGHRAEPPNTGPGPLSCNACGGIGKRKNFATDYPFVVDNVREFTAFLRDCGGFNIY
ncbi:MAG: hypothetical protein LBO00_00375 [Zoogloeaceae bacterium]|jgi:hypothetical protein|nr:hypothetical protein [Zoogloeaceae bacterium]